MGVGPSTPAGYQNLLAMTGNSLDDDAPISAFRAFCTRNNLQHLIDQSSQVRVNWAAIGSTDHLVVGENEVAVWSWPFVHSWMHPQLPTGLYIRICGETIDITARIVPADTQQGDLSAEAYWEGTGSESGGTLTALIEDIYYETSGTPRGYWAPFSIVEDGIARLVHVPLARLDIIATANHPDGGSIDAVTVREFI